jgi:hypothetical protein
MLHKMYLANVPLQAVENSNERYPVVQSISLLKDHYKSYRDFERAVALLDRPV